MAVSVAQVIKTVHVVVTAGWYKSQFVYCREVAPGTASYTLSKLCLWEGILFSRCPKVLPTDRVS